MIAKPLVNVLALGLAAFLPQLAAQPANALPFDRGVKIDVIASKPSDVKGGDFDDKTQKIVLKVKFSDIDTRQAYEGYTATVSAFGQAVLERDTRKVLMQEKIPVSLAPLKSMEHMCPAVKTQFDKTGAKFGYFYDGWVVVVKDSSGKVIHVKSTSPAIEKLPDKAEKLEVGKCYNRALEVVDDPDPSYPRRTSSQ
jgi:hypothetical protein